MSEDEKPAEISARDLDQLVSELRHQRTVCEAKEAELTVENKKKAVIEMKLATSLKALGRDNYSTPEGIFYFIRKWNFTLPQSEQDKRSFIAWLEEQGIAEKYLTVHSSSYNSLLNQEREAAIREGRFLSIPGVPEPKLHETVGFKKGK